MKLFTKICLIICSVFVCIGIVCMGVGVALGSGIREVMEMADDGQFDVGGWNIRKWGIFYNGFWEDDVEPQEVEEGILLESFSKDEIENLNIDIKYGKVSLIDSDSDEIEVRIDAPKRNKYQCKKEGHTMVLKDKTSHHFWKHMAISGEVEITIAIPEGKMFDEVELVTNAGTVDITHSLSAKEMDLEVDAGELLAEYIYASEELVFDVGAGEAHIEQFEASVLEAECGMGQMNLTGKVLNKANLKCGMGQIDLNLNAKETDYDYDIDCGMGNISLNGENISDSGLSASTSIKNGAGRKIKLDCGMGSITIITEEE